MLGRLKILSIFGALLTLSFFIDKHLLLLASLQIPLINHFFNFVASWPGIMALLLILPIFWTNRIKVPIIAGSMGLSIASAWGLKFLFMRPRPFEVVATPAFPSVHVAAAFGAACILSKKIPNFKALWLGYAVLIALGRIWLGLHWPSDCVAGALLGWIIGWGFLWLEKRQV